MKKLLLLLPLFVTSASSQAAVDPKIAEFCMRATDFAGCVQTMTGGPSPKQMSDVEDGLRTWTRDDGAVVRMRTNSVMALQNNGKYGRYIEYRYGVERKTNQSSWIAQADCQDYTANWDQDNQGWRKVKDPGMYLRPGEDSGWYNAVVEAKAMLDEFCPIIETLPKGGEVD